jgi:hypothetical protein
LLRRLLAVACFLALPAVARAEILYLKSGAVLPCSIRKATAASLIVETSFGFSRVPLEQVRRIEVDAPRRVEVRTLAAPPLETVLLSISAAGIEVALSADESRRFAWAELDSVIFLP